MRLSLPSKGRLADDTLDFLNQCGLKVYKPNPRQYEARLPALPEVTVLFQRPADIVVSVRDGSVDFGITGIDVLQERCGNNGEILTLHNELGFGHCALCLAVPESWQTVHTLNDLVNYAAQQPAPLRIATKYPNLTSQFLAPHGIAYSLISAEGTLETAPAIGYADLIADLVSSGQTLRDNRLRPLESGQILASQAALIANRRSLQTNPQALAVARQLLEFIEAHLRGSENLAIFANIRGNSPEQIAQNLFNQTDVGGLQGPTISSVYVRDGSPGWYAVNIIVRRTQLYNAISQLRAIGGSGVVVTLVTYIFDEEPPRYTALLAALASQPQGD